MLTGESPEPSLPPSLPPFLSMPDSSILLHSTPIAMATTSHHEGMGAEDERVRTHARTQHTHKPWPFFFSSGKGSMITQFLLDLLLPSSLSIQSVIPICLCSASRCPVIPPDKAASPCSSSRQSHCKDTHTHYLEYTHPYGYRMYAHALLKHKTKNTHSHRILQLAPSSIGNVAPQQHIRCDRSTLVAAALFTAPPPHRS